MALRREQGYSLVTRVTQVWTNLGMAELAWWTTPLERSGALAESVAQHEPTRELKHVGEVGIRV